MENAQESGHNHGNTNILFLERELFYFILFAKTAHFSGREWIRSNFRLTDEACASDSVIFTHVHIALWGVADLW